MSSLDVTFVTAGETVWTGPAAQVVVPALDGSMGILPGMQPTLSILGSGEIRVIGEGSGIEAFMVEGGFVSVDQDVVTIGADEVRSASSISR